MENKKPSVSRAVTQAAAILGSQKALANIIGVSPQTVWAWINRNSVPALHCVPIERAVGGAVTRRDLRPADFHLIWPELDRGGKKVKPSLTKIKKEKSKKVSREAA